jgi:hypothetical protein
MNWVVYLVAGIAVFWLGYRFGRTRTEVDHDIDDERRYNPGHGEP